MIVINSIFPRSGTGLLSIFAAQAGAAAVYCCEMGIDLASMAELCTQRNGVNEIVHVIKKHSACLTVGPGPGHDIPRRVDVIVTELVDSGLLGEHIVATLGDARKRLLEPGGTIIPHCATVTAVLVESPQLARRQRLCPSELSPPPATNPSKAHGVRVLWFTKTVIK